ncbi:MAG TPA: bifunctional helix-turn-helix transcriptional regulator/GNAT family N-acetyltransferase [Terriglobales bacterium]|nr:bifunctional helix-turn-helix transcriptional regulator/GNAT family N-acetyltransferase [Terriglobales bacterium]
MVAQDPAIASVRRFNRFYTKQIGLLTDHLHSSRLSLTEVRVLYELAHRDQWTASELGQELGLDRGYLSRILRRFQSEGLIERQQSKSDGRQTILTLTEKGRTEFEPLNAAASTEINNLLERLSAPDRHQLVRAMHTIENLLSPPDPAREPIILRSHRPGDMGWIVHRHGELYWQEYGWDERFEALVAEIVAEFVKNYDPKREKCWVAERNGEIVGSIFLVRKDDDTAKLRMLYLEPSARGLGLGRRLVEECVRYAKQVGYKKMTLWTQANLTAARAIYQKTGFRLMSQQKNRSFGKDLVAETWERDL